MNQPDIIQQQRNREEQERKTSFKKLQNDLKEQTQRCDGINTYYVKNPCRSGLNPRGVYRL